MSIDTADNTNGGIKSLCLRSAEIRAGIRNVPGFLLVFGMGGSFLSQAVVPAILLAGPTAVGKSAVALRLCEGLGGRAEIVSVDSVQIYRGMDIGSAKPDKATQARVPHHLLDLLDPSQSYSAARFAADAQTAVAAIRTRGHVPVLVGGTMLYFRALLHGLSPLPAADATVRARLEAQSRQFGWPALHKRLTQEDPTTAARLHPNDAQRIQRALEILELTGKAPSQLQEQARSIADIGPWRGYALLPPDRSALHARIEVRFRRMMQAGFLQEVSRLHDKNGLHAELPAMRAVGYRQLWAYLEGDYGVDEAVQRGIAATRQYAKRQLTWLRRDSAFVQVTATEPNIDTLVSTLLKAVRADAI